MWPTWIHVFGFAEFESVARILSSGHNFFLTEIIKTPLRHPIENFKDFSGTRIDSKNSEKMHGHLW